MATRKKSYKSKKKLVKTPPPPPPWPALAPGEVWLFRYSGEATSLQLGPGNLVTAAKPLAVEDPSCLPLTYKDAMNVPGLTVQVVTKGEVPKAHAAQTTESKPAEQMVAVVWIGDTKFRHTQHGMFEKGVPTLVPKHVATELVKRIAAMELASR